MQRKLGFLVLVCLIVNVNTGYTRILNVPDDFATIQAGIDSAGAGDTVLVAPGVYRENVTIAKRGNLVLGSYVLTTGDRSYRDSTIIDGGGIWKVLQIRPIAVHLTTEVHGLTLVNGLGPTSAGLGASGLERLVLKNIWVKDCEGSNTPYGGIVVTGTNHLVLENFRETNCSGGAGALIASTITMRDCDFSSNHSNGIIFQTNYSDIDRVTFCDNEGWGLHLHPMEPTARFHNHLTITGTRATQELPGYGLMIRTGNINQVNAVLVNSIISNNEGGSIFLQEGPDAEASLTVGFSDIAGGRENVQTDGDAEVIWNEGNINADPLFRDPQNGNYHLTANSPCIDAGNPDSTLDPDGSRTDMGAFPYNRLHLVHHLPDIQMNEDPGVVNVADLDTVFVADRQDSLVFTMESDSSLGWSIDPDHLLTLNPARDFIGDSLLILITATDGLDSLSDTFYVDITPVNDPPREFHLISPATDSLISYRDTLSFTWEPAADPDGAPVRYSFRLRLWDWFTRTNIEEDVTLEMGADTTLVLPDFRRNFIWLNNGCVDAPYEWWVEAISDSDTVQSAERHWVDVMGSGAVAGRSVIPNSFGISALYPSPFNSSVSISYSIQCPGFIRLGAYDELGRLVDQVWEGYASPGRYTRVWDGAGVPSGRLFIRLESADGRSVAAPVTLVR